MTTTYEQEFQLNLENQIPKLNEIMQVGYAIDNYLMFTIIIPNKLYPFKSNYALKKRKGEGHSSQKQGGFS
jgi:hypothetical protein